MVGLRQVPRILEFSSLKNYCLKYGVLAKQIAELFEIERSVATKHINNIFKDQELDKDSVCANFAHTANDGKTYKVKFYNLDIILAVGYRTSSANAIKFRIWATSILKKHLVQGYTINEKRLKAAQEHFLKLQKTIAFLSEKSKKTNLKGQEVEILNLLHDYSNSLTFLEQFDKNSLPSHLHKPNGEKKINDNALTALALLVAESDPKEKDLMIRLVENLIG